MVAFVLSIIVTALLALGINWYTKRCPVDKVFTWGEAMLFATYVSVSYTHLTLPTKA